MSIAAGPGLIVLVGPRGSGKTYTLAAIAAGIGGQWAQIRLPSQPVPAGVALDIVDGIDADALERLLATRTVQKIRVLAIAPELLEQVVDAYAEARVVHVQPMASRDMQVMIAVRSTQMRLPRNAFTRTALTKLEQLCGGSPRTLDRLLDHACSLARTMKSPTITIECIMIARQRLQAASTTASNLRISRGAPAAATGIPDAVFATIEQSIPAAPANDSAAVDDLPIRLPPDAAASWANQNKPGRARSARGDAGRYALVDASPNVPDAATATGPAPLRFSHQGRSILAMLEKASLWNIMRPSPGELQAAEDVEAIRRWRSLRKVVLASVVVVALALALVNQLDRVGDPAADAVPELGTAARSTDPATLPDLVSPRPWAYGNALPPRAGKLVGMEPVTNPPPVVLPTPAQTRDSRDPELAMDASRMSTVGQH